MDATSYWQTALRARRHSEELALDAIEMRVRAAGYRHDLDMSKAFVRAATRAFRARSAWVGLEEPDAVAIELPRQRGVTVQGIPPSLPPELSTRRLR